MDARIRRLASLEEPEGTVVTLALDLSKSGRLPPATRVFLKEQAADALESEVRPEPVRGALRRIARRLREFVARGVKPETEGLFLVAGRGTWEAWELGVPLRNFIEIGRKPYLAPILEAGARAPRAYVVRLDGRGAEIDELHLGRRRAAGTVEAPDPAVPGERIAARRSRYRLHAQGGAERDRFRKREAELLHGVHLRTAALLAGLDRKAPAAAVLVAGARDAFAALGRELPAGLAGRARRIGSTDAGAAEELRKLAEGRIEAELLEFHERRAQGRLVALGAGDVLGQLALGRVARVYVDAADPVPGVRCLSCGARYAGLTPSCLRCEGEVAAASMVQELVGHALTHPSLGITFVPAGSGWLKDLGGLAALLAERGLGRRTAAAGR